MPVLSLRPSRDGDAPVRECSRPASAALDWNGESPFRTAGNDEQASTVTRAGWWKAGRDQEARSVVALSRVPRGERGAPVSPPAAGRGEQGSEISSLAAVRPLVRMPTDRHTATGTCEIGHH